MNSDDARNESQRALLRAQAWGPILKRLTAIAFKRIRRSSLSDAKDLAQAAMADAYRTVEGGGWDPERGPLVGFLVSRVIGHSSNERRRKRNQCEVWLDQEVEDEDGDSVSAHEKYLRDDRPSADEVLHRLRFARTFHQRLTARLSADTHAMEIIALLLDGVSTPRDLATAASCSVAEVVETRRRIHYHAHQITKELSTAAGTPRADSRSNEVTQ